MSEELKEGEQPQDVLQGKRSPALSILKVIIGLSLLALGGIALVTWKKELLVLLRGFSGLFLILAGTITLAIARE